MKRLATLVLLLLVVFSLSAVSIRDVMSEFPEEKVESFLSGSLVKFYSHEGKNVPSIAFDGTMGKEKAVADYANEDCFTAGLSCFVPYPASWSSMTEEEKKLEIINTLLKISSIKGITYISYSAGNKPKVLFEDAYALTDKGKKGQNPEFSYAPVEYSYSLNAYLKDNIFGGNDYKINYEIKGNEVFMTMTNTTDMKVLLFKAVAKKELNMCIDLLMTDEGIALFGMATVFGRDIEVKTPITTVHLPSAFMRRVTALRDWFVQEIEK